MSITTVLVAEENLKPIPSGDLTFGRHFSDHMFTYKYSEGKGWYDATIEPYAPFSFDPATAVLHYAQEIFEGLKAYRRPDGDINLFRPDQNAARFNRSAARMAMAEVDEKERPFEFMMNQLRLHSTFSIKHFQTSTGLGIETVLPQLTLAKNKGLMENEVIRNDEYWHVTTTGQRYLNDLLEIFL